MKRIANYDDFINKWWAERFPDAEPPKWDSAITCADASDLVRAFEDDLIKTLRKTKP